MYGPRIIRASRIPWRLPFKGSINGFCKGSEGLFKNDFEYFLTFWLGSRKVVFCFIRGDLGQRVRTSGV